MAVTKTHKEKKASTKTSSDGVTPLMQQYLQIKTRYPNEILFFRLGDFYEMFFEDAIKAAPVLEVALTKRQTTPMCGVPHHAVTGYMAKLLKAGLSVAMAEQLEDPKKTKGMVKRDVVRVITPGTILEDELLPSKANNFLVTLYMNKSDKQGLGHWALAVADVSTGRQWVGEVEGDLHWNQLRARLASLDPSEILLVGDVTQEACKNLTFSSVIRLEPLPSESNNMCEHVTLAMQAYLTRHNAMGSKTKSDSSAEKKAWQPKTTEPLPLPSNGTLFLDESAIRHLELVQSADPSGAGPTLLSVLDESVTPLGSRLLRWWILHPSCDRLTIQERLDQVEDFVEAATMRDHIRFMLKDVADLERIRVRVEAGTASPRDLEALRNSLNKIPQIRAGLKSLKDQISNDHFSDIDKNLKYPSELIGILENQLSEAPPSKVIDGGVIKEGFSFELDELRRFRRVGKSWIATLESTERQKTNITNLKIGYNDVFGYYLEVSKSHLSKVPSDWVRKQTLTNAERFITPDLKEQEEKILGAQEKIQKLELKLYQELVHQLASFSLTLSDVAQALAHLDAVSSLAFVAVENGYIRPNLSDSDELVIKGGRHPVIEKNLGRDRFIPNDVSLGGEGKRISIITGPNMAGKSTYLRQTALIVILAQMGSFVPAEQADIGLVDRIFTRIGASDRLSQGQSTFMVEMAEVANLLINCTNKSLLVLDEVGRGTSTYDGVSIAWAVIDYLSQNGKPRTLFATHYFELTQLAESLPGVMNAHATAKEWPGPDGRKQVVFLYQILPGPADRSYGIHVAEMAGIPNDCVKRAREILKQLETGSHRIQKAGVPEKKEAQLDLFSEHPIIAELKNTPVEQMTPLEALNKLAELKQKADT